jgi:Na+/phosphate symporter
MPDSNDNPREVIARGSIPIPDPTLLTTQQLYREIAIIRTLVDDRTSSVREVTDIRFKGLDTAIKLLSDNIIELTDRAVHEAKTLQARLDEKFKSVQIQFEERDKRSEQRAFADTTAVVAALQAQKDAVNSQNVANAAAASKS